MVSSCSNLKYLHNLYYISVIVFTLLLPFEVKSQRVDKEDENGVTYNKTIPYFNVGYVTNLALGCSDCNKDSGGSIRIGILTKGRLGFYTGYLWYNVDHFEVTDYDDKGSAFLFGIDLRLIIRPDFKYYLQLGMASEKFKSIYHSSNRIETENYLIPQLGIVFHTLNYNAYIGMGATHFNLGVGVTL